MLSRSIWVIGSSREMGVFGRIRRGWSNRLYGEARTHVSRAPFPYTRPMRGPTRILEILRDFVEVDRLVRGLARRHRAHGLRFPELAALIRDDESSVLFRLKERTHALFRGPGGVVRGSDASRGAVRPRRRLAVPRGDEAAREPLPARGLRPARARAPIRCRGGVEGPVRRVREDARRRRRAARRGRARARDPRAADRRPAPAADRRAARRRRRARS